MPLPVNLLVDWLDGMAHQHQFRFADRLAELGVSPEAPAASDDRRRPSGSESRRRRLRRGGQVAAKRGALQAGRTRRSVVGESPSPPSSCWAIV